MYKFTLPEAEEKLRSLAHDNEKEFVADLITAVLNAGVADKIIEELEELGYPMRFELE